MHRPRGPSPNRGGGGGLRLGGRARPALAGPACRSGAACLTATCDQWENGCESISSIDTSQASIRPTWLGAKTNSHLAHPPGGDHPAVRTDSDLARLPGGDHPAAQHASQGVLTRSAARRGSRMRLPGRLGRLGSRRKLVTWKFNRTELSRNDSFIQGLNPIGCAFDFLSILW